MAGSGYPPHDATHQGADKFFSVLAAKEAHWPLASVGTGLDDHLPRSPAIQLHVPSAPGAPGAAAGVLLSGACATSYGA